MSYTLKLWLGSGVGVSTFEPIAAGVYHIYVLGESGPTWSGVGVTKT
jgi:hypothetical protein